MLKPGADVRFVAIVKAVNLTDWTKFLPHISYTCVGKNSVP